MSCGPLSSAARGEDSRIGFGSLEEGKEYSEL